MHAVLLCICISSLSVHGKLLINRWLQSLVNLNPTKTLNMSEGFALMAFIYKGQVTT